MGTPVQEVIIIIAVGAKCLKPSLDSDSHMCYLLPWCLGSSGKFLCVHQNGGWFPGRSWVTTALLSLKAGFYNTSFW